MSYGYSKHPADVMEYQVWTIENDDDGYVTRDLYLDGFADLDEAKEYTRYLDYCGRRIMLYFYRRATGQYFPLTVYTYLTPDGEEVCSHDYAVGYTG